MSVLGQFNETWWLEVDGPTQVKPDWPVIAQENVIPLSQSLYGTLEIVSPDRIEYSVPGFGVAATYQPAPDDYQPRFCI